MSWPFSFGDDYQEDITKLFLDAVPLELLDCEEGDSSVQALLEGSRYTHIHDHLILGMPLNAQTDTRLTHSEQLFTPSLQPVIKGQIVNHLSQCIDHLEVTGDSVKGGAHVRKRRRGPDWSDQEKRFYLTLKLEALGLVKGKDWDFISQNLEKRHGVRRSAKCCEDLWGTLRKYSMRIRGHESNCRVSYWEMDADGRARNKLPRSFPEDSFRMMESILAAQEQRSKKNSKVSNSRKNAGNEGRDGAWNSMHRGKRPEPDPQLKQHVNSALHMREEEETVLTLLSRWLKSAVELSNVANTERELLERSMMDAIHSVLVKPIVSDLREKGRLEVLEMEARMNAVVEKGRALDWEEKQIKRQRLGRVPSSKRLGRRQGTGIER